MSDRKPGTRKREILEALALELERNPGDRITTAALARSVGVSEAALYRHFPSKAKMFDALLEFAEEAVFGIVNRILAEERDPARRCERIVAVVLGFSARNPGITRMLTGEALVGETERLRARVLQFFNRLETQLKQVIREGTKHQAETIHAPVAVWAGLLLAVVQGRMQQFVQSGFSRAPDGDWAEYWVALSDGIFAGVARLNELG